MQHYDFIIAGGGASGLSLVYRILQEPSLKEKKILIIDKSKKQDNDRTWCFWEKEKDIFENLIFHRWGQVHFYSSYFAKKLDLQPYEYKMIRGIDFYEHVIKETKRYDNVEWHYGEVSDFQDGRNYAQVQVGDHSFRGDYIFNSIRRPDEKKLAENHHYLLQHFKGWVIETEKPYFNSDSATLMDFRISQHNDCRFMYVLPTDERRALIEYTIFSSNLLEDKEYTRELEKYISDLKGIGNYKIVHEEFGVIPMTDLPYQSVQSKHIINIGTAGGYTKPSTGYTFKRIQENTAKIVHQLKTGTRPRNEDNYTRFHLYDSTLLNVMENNLYPADKIFTKLFKGNRPSDVFAFLDEDTTFPKEVKIMIQMPSIPFIKGIINSLRLKKRL